MGRRDEPRGSLGESTRAIPQELHGCVVERPRPPSSEETPPQSLAFVSTPHPRARPPSRARCSPPTAMAAALRVAQWTLHGLKWYTRAGFEEKTAARRRSATLPDMSEKCVVITGAARGLGRSAALALARRGANPLILVCRGRESGEAAAAEIRAASAEAAFGTGPDPAAAGPNVAVVVGDCSSVASVRAAAVEVDRLAGPKGVHALVHNAGVLVDAPSASAEGFEITWATAVLGPLALTHALGPALSRAAAAARPNRPEDRPRVVWVSSGGALLAPLTALPASGVAPPPARRFDGPAAYQAAKRQQISLAAALTRRDPEGHGALHVACHPGWCDTPGVQARRRPTDPGTTGPALCLDARRPRRRVNSLLSPRSTLSCLPVLHQCPTAPPSFPLLITCP